MFPRQNVRMPKRTRIVLDDMSLLTDKTIIYQARKIQDNIDAASTEKEKEEWLELRTKLINEIRGVSDHGLWVKLLNDYSIWSGDVKFY